MSSGGNPVIIGLSKTKILLLLTGSLAFVAGSVWLLLIASSQALYEASFITSASVLGILFFGLCGFYSIKKAFDKTPGLIIDDLGIQDNSNSGRRRFISWKNIEGFNIEDVHGTKLVLVMIDNAEVFVAQQPKWAQIWMNMSIKLYDTPVVISSNTLECTFDQLVQLTTERFYALKG